jgi:hypothetical protein
MLFILYFYGPVSLPGAAWANYPRLNMCWRLLFERVTGVANKPFHASKMEAQYTDPVRWFQEEAA